MRALFVVAALVLITGCGSSGDTSEGRSAKTDSFYVQLPDGKSVVCVTYDDVNFGTELSCDWAGVKRD